MAKNIKRLMKEKGKDRNDVCKDLGFKYTTFTDWVNGNTYPRIDKIEMMANYFGVSKAELVEDVSSNASLKSLQIRRLTHYAHLMHVYFEDQRFADYANKLRYLDNDQKEVIYSMIDNMEHRNADSVSTGVNIKNILDYIDTTEPIAAHSQENATQDDDKQDDAMMDDDDEWK